ncbi:ABC transporter permease [Faecalicatena sp. AGMB00832]|uniref:ABC transporter permease n=1 Tax=Faecalicatena faecalis TaxID=2726362 RepID=A0ABS6D4U0_9FIRM|nr:ABC transporter permease [Faecalicatena faecalis]MBU3876237.1 ABC transporter permease [Faecalicatena faecalis]
MRSLGILKQFDGQAGFYYQKDVVTGKQLKDFWENASEDAKREIKGLVFFRTEKDVEIKNESLGRSEIGDLIETAGNMYLVVSGRLVKGSFVTDSDLRGCVLSKKSAELLFGDDDIIGEEVRVGKKTYRVRGIVDLSQSLCMVQGEAENGYPCIRADAPRLPLSVMQQMLAGLLLPECEWISEGNLYYGVGRFFLWLPAWLILSVGIMECRKRMRLIQNKVLRAGMEMGIPVAAFLGVCVILLVSLRFSDDYIPTAWSDFAFWTELFRKKRELSITLIGNPFQIADSIMLGSLAAVMAAGVLLFLCLLGRCIRRGEVPPNRSEQYFHSNVQGNVQSDCS